MCTFKNTLTILLVLFTSSIMVTGQQWSAISSEGNFWSLNTGNVGIGTVSPREKIDILGNGIITGKLGIGVSTNPVKKLEIWDGNAGRFTFSAASCTSGYEIAQTIDDTGYKLNVGSSIRNYKISLNGADKLKLLVNENIAFGTSSLNGITTGSDNTALGQYSLYSNTTGYHNIAIGPSAMKLNQTGAQNVAIGVYSLSNCTASDGNTAIGANSLRYTTTGVHNSALGKASLFNNTTGNYNMAIGSLALYNNTTGSNNHSMGFGALLKNTTGFNNIGIGYYAGAYIADGSSNNATSNNSLFIGSNTKAQADGQTNQIVIGNDVVGNGSNSVTLGNSAITSTILYGNVGIGTATPNAKLEVAGKIRSYGDIYGSTVLTFQDDSRFPVTQTEVPSLNSTSFSMPQYGIAAPSVGGSADLWIAGNHGIRIFTQGTQRFLINSNGKIAIGVTKPDEYLATSPIDELLTVNGTIHAREIKIDLNTNLADYVFNSDYELMPLPEVEKFVKENKHLPEIPSAAEVKENGLSVGEMQNKLLQKIEELTLYVIELQKTNEMQNAEIEELKRK